MPRNFDRYRMIDGRTRLGAAYFNAIWTDIDLRLAELEQIEITWEDAVRQVSEFGLVRINQVLAGPIQEINTEMGKLRTALAGLPYAVTSAELATALQQQDQARAQLASTINAAIAEINTDLAQLGGPQLPLVPTGVDAGTYGGAAAIPVLQIGPDGRVVHAENIAIEVQSSVVVSVPQISAPAVAGAGYPHTITASAQSLLAAPTAIASFEFVLSDGSVVNRPAASGSATCTFTVTAAVGSTITMKARAIDTLGNRSAPAQTTSSVVSAGVQQPAITAPASGATTNLTPSVTSNAFTPVGLSDTHEMSDWEIRNAPNGGGALVASSSSSTANKTTWTVPAGNLADGVTYYARVRHKGTNLGWSNWSADRSFVARVPSIAKPSIVGPADGTTGVARKPTVTSSAFSVIAGTDTHAATEWELVETLGGTNYLQGSTTAATSVTVSINLKFETAYSVRVRHKGTNLGYSEWSDYVSFTTLADPYPDSLIGTAMLGGYLAGKRTYGADQYAIIVAPKSTEVSRQYFSSGTDNSNTTATGWVDGLANSNAINDSSHPAAQYCRSLTTGGYNDWYLPARAELSFVFTKFKPSTTLNFEQSPYRNTTYFTSGNGVDGGGNGQENTFNVNPYTTTDPAQTTVTAFRSGGAQAFSTGTYIASNSHTTSNCWGQQFSDGKQVSVSKTTSSTVRAIRRVPV